MLHVGSGRPVCCGEAMECAENFFRANHKSRAICGDDRTKGWCTVARHFKGAAENKKWHARAQFKACHKLVDGAETEVTLKNLDSGVASENYGHTVVYPDFAKIAEAKGYRDLARLFNTIGKVEVEHEREYRTFQNAIREDGAFKSENEEIWVCEVCGHIHRGKKAPDACPLCKTSKEYFKRESLGI